MTLAQELLALLDRAAPHLGPRRVRALIVPPLAAADTLAGEFCALELDSGAVGLSYVLLDGVLAQLTDEPALAAALVGRDALDVARDYLDPSPVRRTIGFAAVNALTRALYDRAGYVPPSSADSTGELDFGPGDHVGMIGYFKRLIPRVLASGAQLTIAELRANLAGEHDGYRVTLDPADLRTCTQIMSTSTLLLNDTLDRMLAAGANARRFSLIGPGAACLPDPLFARGVTALGGTWVDDLPAFRRKVVAGENWARSARKVTVQRDAYPGFDALLARAAAGDGARP